MSIKSEKNRVKFFAKNSLVLFIEIILFLVIIIFGYTGGVLLHHSVSEKETDLLGIIIPEDNSDYYISLADSLTDNAAYFDLNSIIYTVEDMGNEALALDALIEKGVKAVIIDPEGLSAEEIKNIDNRCQVAGVVCVFLLNEGEDKEICTSSVWCNFEFLGASMAYNLNKQNVYILQSKTSGEYEKKLSKGLFEDSKYGLKSNSNSNIKGTAYIDELYTVEEAVFDALSKYSDITAFCVLDKQYAQPVYQELYKQGYSGELYCFIDEAILDDSIESESSAVVIRDFYFSISDMAYMCVEAVADQLRYEVNPKHYVIYPYGW